MFTYIHTEPKALKKSDTVSATRELFLEKQEPVALRFEMDDEEAFFVFNQLPEHVLPPIPNGYQWVKANNNYSVIRHTSSKDHEITMILYGPDKTNKINFLCQVDGVTRYSFAHTKTGTGPASRAYPMSSADYRVRGYDYSSKRYKGHVRGHLIDHQDTITGKSTLSTKDPRNYVPEPPEYEWGLGIRRLKVAELRKQRGDSAYTQLNMYSDKPLVTSDGTPVPEDVRLYAYTVKNNYQAKDVYHVEFEEDMHRPKGVKVLEHAADNFVSSIQASPVVVSYEPSLSDRGLRALARSACIREKNIGTPLAPSRFIYKDTLHAACDSGDREFETAGRQLHAGIYAEKDEVVSLAYLKRSLFFGDELSALDTGITFQKEEAAEGDRFFKNKDEDVADLADHFRQLCPK